MPDQPEPTVQATRYEVSLLPEDDINRRHFTLFVEARGGDQWAVTTGFHDCLSVDGVWSYEMRPSEREDDWLAAHRFDLDTALRLAKQAAPHVVVNGRSALEIRRRDYPAPVHVGGNAEDCPACSGTNLPYPFICPSPTPA